MRQRRLAHHPASRLLLLLLCTQQSSSGLIASKTLGGWLSEENRILRLGSRQLVSVAADQRASATSLVLLTDEDAGSSSSSRCLVGSLAGREQVSHSIDSCYLLTYLLHLVSCYSSFGRGVTALEVASLHVVFFDGVG